MCLIGDGGRMLGLRAGDFGPLCLDSGGLDCLVGELGL